MTTKPVSYTTAAASGTAVGAFSRLQQIMIGHGILILFMSLVAGVGLWVSLLGGFELIPGHLIAFQIPGTPEGWAKAHRGTPMNALMIIAVALVLPHLGFTARSQRWLAVVIVGAGWGNTIFYYFSNFSANRGLSFGDNAFGHGGILSVIALAPAYAFGIASMIATLYMAWKILFRR